VGGNGGRFNATGPGGAQVDANTYMELDSVSNGGPGTLLQQVLFHSSCSQQLYLLDIFGSFQLIEFQNTVQGVVGFGINPTVEFSINLNAGAIGTTQPLTLEFLSVVVLSGVPGLLPPQVEQFNVSGTTIPPSFPIKCADDAYC